MTKLKGQFETFKEAVSDRNFETKLADKEKVASLVNDMRNMANRLERLSNDQKLNDSTFKILVQQFAELEGDADTYLDK